VVLRQLKRALLEAVGKALPPGNTATLLDYGCGEMPYKPLLINKIKDYLGADLADNPQATLVLDPNGGIPLPDASVDVVLSTQVLEHVLNPAQYLTEAYRVLRPGGHLVMSTHGVWMYHPQPTDLWRWTSTGLIRQSEAAGFAVVQQVGLLNRAATGLQLFQDGLLFKMPAFLRPLWAAWMQAHVALFDKIGAAAVRDADACTYVQLARKS
jgi:SAM-dependent methyltransferase